MFEDVACQHGPHPESHPVIQSYWRAIVHHPKPNQRLAFTILRCIGVAVIFGLQSCIARVERVHQGALRKISFRSGIFLSEIKPVQSVAHDVAPVLWIRVLEFRIQAFNPLQESFLRFGCGPKVAVFVSWHGIRPLDKSSNIA